MRTLSLSFVIIAAVTGWGLRADAAGGAQTPRSQPLPTVASALDFEISTIEKQILDAVEAMPENRFDFSPERLSIPGGDYKGVRTFAEQAKHVAASNYAIWAPLSEEVIPANFKGGNGPESVKTKAEILRFLKDSFALGHKAAGKLTLQNVLATPDHSTSSRLRLMVFGVTHAFDHYGQMVEYLRMNGIVPPASR